MYKIKLYSIGGIIRQFRHRGGSTPITFSNIFEPEETLTLTRVSQFFVDVYQESDDRHINFELENFINAFRSKDGFGHFYIPAEERPEDVLYTSKLKHLIRDYFSSMDPAVYYFNSSPSFEGGIVPFEDFVTYIPR